MPQTVLPRVSRRLQALSIISTNDGGAAREYESVSKAWDIFGSRLPRRDHRAWVIFEIHANLPVSPYKRKFGCELRPAFETALVTLKPSLSQP